MLSELFPSNLAYLFMNLSLVRKLHDILYIVEIGVIIVFSDIIFEFAQLFLQFLIVFVCVDYLLVQELDFPLEIIGGIAYSI